MAISDSASNDAASNIWQALLWGTAQHAVLCFLEVLWPDFSFTDMCYAVWCYQRAAGHSLDARRRYLQARVARRHTAPAPVRGRVQRGGAGGGGGARRVCTGALRAAAAGAGGAGA